MTRTFHPDEFGTFVAPHNSQIQRLNHVIFGTVVLSKNFSGSFYQLMVDGATIMSPEYYRDKGLSQKLVLQVTCPFDALHPFLQTCRPFDTLHPFLQSSVFLWSWMFGIGTPPPGRGNHLTKSSNALSHKPWQTFSEFSLFKRSNHHVP